tara:strand:- start:107 stop:943 length:837 start_codon:yes stop_codon:yes gene_type:complete
MSEIFREKLHKGLVQEIKIKKSLVDKKSKYQRIQIFDSYTYGRVLALDGIVQITEKDEAAYSEMLVHPAMNFLKSPKNILIIGGGDGAVAEELLKYKFIERIDLVDIDIEVINLSKKYFKKVNNDSLNNKKVHIFAQDAYIFTSNSSIKYDLIIADRPDPVGAGKSLFKLKFYKNIRNLLKADGMAIFQSGVTFLQKNEIKEVSIKIKSVFENSGIILTVVPSYIGGHMALVWASKKIRIGKLKKNKSLKRIKTDYFNLQISEASLSLPNFIKTIQKF